MKQKVNYNEAMNEIIDGLKFVPSILLHSCCGPCSTEVISRLTPYFNITIFYYNPNIEPEDEYLKRKAEQKKFISKFKSINKLTFLDCDYDNDAFIKISNGLEKEAEGGKRCHKCYQLRLLKTCLKAKENSYDYFGTTLTVSPYKNAEVINEIGKKIMDEYHINFLFSDFKKENGYKKSIEYSKNYNLYRQNYCGCRFSTHSVKKYFKITGDVTLKDLDKYIFPKKKLGVIICIENANGEILLQERGPKSRDANGMYEQIGGGIDDSDSSPLEAVKREIREEAGEDIKLQNIHPIGICHELLENGDNWLFVIYKGMYIGGKIKIMEEDKCLSYKFFKYKDALNSDKLSEYAKFIIKNIFENGS